MCGAMEHTTKKRRVEVEVEVEVEPALTRRANISEKMVSRQPK